MSEEVSVGIALLSQQVDLPADIFRSLAHNHPRPCPASLYRQLKKGANEAANVWSTRISL
jgi:hypothetical protein